MSSSTATGDGRTAGLALVAAQSAAVYLLAFRAGHAAPRAAFVFAMFAVAALVNTLWLLARRRRASLWRMPRREVVTALVFAAFSAAGNLFNAYAVKTLGSGPTATLAQTQIFWVALGAYLALGEKVRPPVALGCVLAGAGVVLVRLPAASSASWPLSGVLWALAATACFAMMVVVGRAVAARVDVDRINAARLLLAAPLMLLMPGAAGHVAHLSRAAWGWAALAALGGPVVSRLLQLRALVHMEAAHLRLWMLTTPAWAFALGALVLGHIPGALDLAGAALVLAGAALPSLAAARFGARRRSR